MSIICHHLVKLIHHVKNCQQCVIQQRMNRFKPPVYDRLGVALQMVKREPFKGRFTGQTRQANNGSE